MKSNSNYENKVFENLELTEGEYENIEFIN